MMFISNDSKKYKATGLVEVIFALGILSMTMISVISFTTRALRQIKLDETRDRAQGIQIRAFEVFKSPEGIVSDLQLTRDQDQKYKIVIDDGKILLEQESLSSTLTKENCDLRSPYYVSYKGNPSDVICNQISVGLVTQANEEFYEIKSKLVFLQAGEFQEDELISYRRVS